MKKLDKYKICGDIDSTSTGKLLYLILGEIANKNGEVIIPQKKISNVLHISKGTVSRNLRRLRVLFCAKKEELGGKSRRDK